MHNRGSTVEDHIDLIRYEIKACKGNLVRVHEELESAGVEVSYPSLARFVRVNHLKKPPKPPAGRYPHKPAHEMQFDTSPHDVTFVDGVRHCQCASLVLAYSRRQFFQYYPRFTRFEAKLFLTKGLQHHGGAAAQCMIDNTNVVILYGTGENAVVVPEMIRFAERFGFEFVAHELGDSDRSAVVERRFHHYENNFLVKRRFRDFEDLNRQAIAFCTKHDRIYKNHLKASSLELYAMEASLLKPLPLYIPEVYQLHHRVVDLEGYVTVDTNRYSVPYELMGKQLEVRETETSIQVFHGHQEVAVHERLVPGSRGRITVKAHRPARWDKKGRCNKPLPQETALREHSVLVDQYVTALKRRSRGRAAREMRSLYRMLKEYPRKPFEDALTTALHYGLFNLSRLEKMILKQVAGTYFTFDEEPTE